MTIPNGERPTRLCWLIVARMMGLSAVNFLGISTAYPHDLMRPQLNAWFQSLTNKAGELCCDTGDGQPAEVEWDMAKDGYKVLLKHPHRPTEPGQWFDVPYSVVIDQPNLSGIAMVWWTPSYDSIDGSMTPIWRCFIPGPGDDPHEANTNVHKAAMGQKLPGMAAVGAMRTIGGHSSLQKNIFARDYRGNLPEELHSKMELIMSRMALVIAFVLALIGPASAQKAEVEAANAKWIEFFNKGDFAGIGSLYATDAIALPPGSAMVQGRAAIEAMWKSSAEQVSDPILTTLDVKPLGPSAAREIGTFSLKTKGATPQEVSGKYVVVWEKVGNDWKLATDIWNDGK